MACGKIDLSILKIGAELWNITTWSAITANNSATKWCKKCLNKKETFIKM